MSLWLHYDIMDDIEKRDWLPDYGMLFLEILSRLKRFLIWMKKWTRKD